MKLFKFMKDAGEKLFGKGEAKAAEATPQADAADANRIAGDAIAAYIGSLGLRAENLAVSFDAATQTVRLSGTAADQATREKILLAAGNVHGVAQVEDHMSVVQVEPEARFHTVARGDTLSAIARTYYGNANKYMLIFEANKPMLSHPDKIYPGQSLRIPEQA
jgi:nucleoid-associated protein YgaU